jgi:hypothetical protein
MPTLLHLSTAGVAYWHRSKGAWCEGPDAATESVWVVTDMAEETFAEITVPRIYGGDRQRFVHRQLRNRFPDNPYCKALPMPSKGGLLDRLAPPLQTLVAIDPPERLRDTLAQVQSPIAGVWSTSLLMAALARRVRLQGDVFMVLCTPAGMRIMFLRAQVPALTRLLPDALTAEQQSAEIVRTLRHLENTHAIARDASRLGVLLLGAAPGVADALAGDRLDVLPVPSAWQQQAAGNWQQFVFDMARKSPAPQLAPLRQRAQHVAQRLRLQLMLGTAVVCMAALAYAAWQVNALWQDRQAHAMQNTAAQAQALADVDAQLQHQGVSVQAVRAALTLHNEQITQAPDFRADMLRVSQAVSTAAVPLKHLQWRILPPTERACGAAQDTSAGADSGAAEGAPSLRVELVLEADMPEALTLAQRSQRVQTLSQQLAQLKNTTLITDPRKALQQGELRSAASSSTGLAWCLELRSAAATAPAGGTP